MASDPDTGRKSRSAGDPDDKADAERHQLSVQGLAWDALLRIARTRRTDSGRAEDGDNAAVVAFCSALIAGNAQEAEDLLSGRLDQGAPYEEIADTLFAPAARRLGELWETDALGFADVSLGISTLIRVNAWLRRRSRPETPYRADGMVLFATLPHQAHTLGIILAAEAFRQQNIDVDLMLGSTPEEISRRVSGSGVRLVGLTAGRDNRLPDILALGKDLKAAQHPPFVLLGGATAGSDPEVFAEARIDALVGSITEAIAIAQQVLNAPPTR